MYTFIKFGGSVITDKHGREAADLPAIKRLAEELQAARSADPELRLVLGHGSGSFGHPYAARYGIHLGLAADADWMGFALTAAAALRLNRIVVDTLLEIGLPVISLQPSAALLSSGGSISDWETSAIGRALEQNLIPVIHGDVAFDNLQGSAIISTEALLAHLALRSGLQPSRIVLVGEDAVYTADPRFDLHAEPIPLISRANIAEVLHGTGESAAIDVTGGMRSKIELMWRLVETIPNLEVRLVGVRNGLLLSALRDHEIAYGTTIRLEE